MDSYAVSAKYYDDAYAAEPDLVDLLFYLELAKQFGGPVLETACGTGRILLPIARAGIEIHGVDKSLSMLQVLREQLEREPAEIRNRVTLSKGDMRTFRLSREFHHAVSPAAAHAHLAGSGCAARDRGGSSCAGRNPGL
jgi:SAM-dependent methyltransferase